MFTRVCVEIDVSKLLVPRVSLGSPEESDWPEFLYENMGIFCFQCGFIDIIHPITLYLLIVLRSIKWRPLQGVELYMRCL